MQLAKPGNTKARARSGAEEDFVRPPTATLPNGSGAIRGIAEKFAANPVTGTSSITVPLAISPGRSGFGLQLSLSYDSEAGNGPFGLPLPPPSLVGQNGASRGTAIPRSRTCSSCPGGGRRALPSGLDGASYQRVDLAGDGTAGVLTEQADGWF